MQRQGSRHRRSGDLATSAKRLVRAREAPMLVAILDDDKKRCTEMERSLRSAEPDIQPHFFDSAPDMIAWLARHLDSVALVSLTHDLGPSRFRDGVLFDPGTGRDVTDFLVEMERRFPVIIHAAAAPRNRDMVKPLERAGWPCVQIEPGKGIEWISAEWANRISELLR